MQPGRLIMTQSREQATSAKFISVQAVALLLDVSPSTVYEQWRIWGLKGYRFGKHLRFRQREVEAWTEQQAA
jgi:excisionase family DNA binding protein